MKKNFLILPAICFYLLTIAQESELQQFKNGFYIKQFSEASGLVNNACKYLYEDTRGFIWVCTFSGLSRFDGKQFINYGVKEGLPGTNITQVSEDSSGVIYVATTTGIARYTGYIKSPGICFYIYPQTTGLEGLLSGMQPIDSNTIIFQKNNGAVYSLIKNKLLQLTPDAGSAGLKMYRRDNHYFYAFIPDTIRVFNTRFENVKNFFFKSSEFSTESVDSAGRIHLYSPGSIQRLEDDKIVFEGNAPDSIGCFVNTDTLHRMFYDRGNVIRYYDGMVDLPVLDMNQLSMQTNRLLHAKDGSIWSTSTGIGLFRITKLPYSISEMHDPVSYHCKNGKRIIYDNKRFNSNPFFVRARDSLRPIIISILIDRNNNAWFCTEKGLYKQPPDGRGRFYIFTGDKLIWNSSAELHQAIEFPNGDLWFYGVAGGILFRDEKFQHFTSRNGLTEYGGAIAHIVGDKDGNVLVMDYFDRKLYHVEGDTILPVSNIKDGGNFYPNSIVRDSRGYVWMEHNKTLYRLEKRLIGSFDITDSLLPSDINKAEIKTFNFDSQDRCWVNYAGGNIQVFFLNQDGHYSHTNSISYTKDDGLGSFGISFNTLYPDDDGNMLLIPAKTDVGSVASFSIANALQRKQLMTPVVSIVGIDINLEKADRLLPENIRRNNKAGAVRLPHKENNILFNYSSSALSHPSNLIYKIMLEGFDKKWRITDLTSVSYTNLPAGSYIFLVQAANVNGTWGPVCKYPFIILPAWYNTWWATLLFMAVCVLVIYVIFYIHLSGVRMHHIEESSLFKSSLIGLIGHDMVTPLLYIAKVSRQLRNYNEKLSRETTLESLGEIDTTATQLHFFGESIIHWIKIQNTDFKPVFEQFSISKTIKELADFHHPLFAEKGTDLNYKMEEEIIGYQDSTLVRIIVHNLLLNANKFTSNGKVTITSTVRNDWATIIVKDNGRGMDEERVDSLNNLRAIHSSPGTSKEKGWGMGYKVIIDLLRFTDGKLHISSRLNEGTEVTIKLPCSEDLIIEKKRSAFSDNLAEFKN